MASNFISLLFERIYFESFNYFNPLENLGIIVVSESKDDQNQYEDFELIALNEVTLSQSRKPDS